MTLDAIASDKSDYKAEIRKKDASEDDKEQALRMLALQRLAAGANTNLDSAFNALFSV